MPSAVTPGRPGTSNDLGGKLFEYKVGEGRVIALAALPAALLGGGGAWALNAAPPKLDLAVGLFAAAALIFLASAFVGRIRVFVHERGIVEEARFFGTRVFRDEEFEHMTWRAVKPAVGVGIAARLTTASSSFRVQRGVDTGGTMQRNLEALRDRIASRIAGRAQQNLSRGVSFAWGSDRGARVRLEPDGIRYRKVKFVGHEDQFAAWTQPLEIGFLMGRCTVLADGKELFTLATAEPDFFPGLTLVTLLGKVRWK
jgi:hypothetical protein